MLSSSKIQSHLLLLLSKIVSVLKSVARWFTGKGAWLFIVPSQRAKLEAPVHAQCHTNNNEARRDIEPIEEMLS